MQTVTTVVKQLIIRTEARSDPLTKGMDKQTRWQAIKHDSLTTANQSIGQRMYNSLEFDNVWRRLTNVCVLLAFFGRCLHAGAKSAKKKGEKKTEHRQARGLMTGF